MQHHIDRLRKQLDSLETQKRSIEAHILQIKRELEKHSTLTKENKIALFRSLFIGREDVYAQYWISDITSKQFRLNTKHYSITFR